MKRFVIFSLITLGVLAVATGAMGHNAVVTAPGLDASNYKLELQYTAADPTRATVQDASPEMESVYRARFTLNLNGAGGSSFRNDNAFVYVFQAFGDGRFANVGLCPATTVGPIIRAGVQKVGSQYAVRVFAFDNQCSRRSPLPGCIISDTSADVEVQIQWQAINNTADNFSVQLFEGGSEVCSSAVQVQNGNTRITHQAFTTIPDAATPVLNDHTVHVDNFESYRTLAP